MENQTFWSQVSNMKAFENRAQLPKGRMYSTTKIWSIRANKLILNVPPEIMRISIISVLKKRIPSWIRSNFPIQEED